MYKVKATIYFDRESAPKPGRTEIKVEYTTDTDINDLTRSLSLLGASIQQGLLRFCEDNQVKGVYNPTMLGEIKYLPGSVAGEFSWKIHNLEEVLNVKNSIAW